MDYSTEYCPHCGKQGGMALLSTDSPRRWLCDLCERRATNYEVDAYRVILVQRKADEEMARSVRGGTVTDDTVDRQLSWLHTLSRRLVSLLDNPQPGLTAWWECLEDCAEGIGDWCSRPERRPSQRGITFGEPPDDHVIRDNKIVEGP